MTMKTARDRLEFAIAFANKDLDQLRPGDWMNLRDDLKTFLGWGGPIFVVPLVPPLVHDLPPDDIKKLQASARQPLGDVADSHKLLTPSPHAEGVGTQMISPVLIERVHVSVLTLNAIGQAIPHVTGGVRDCTLLLLVTLLAQDPGSIRRCPDPGCGRLFYRVRRQLFCSKQCVNRANKRDARKKERAPKESKTVPAIVPASTRNQPKTSQRQPTTKRKTRR